jgi:hypothetical protein
MRKILMAVALLLAPAAAVVAVDVGPAAAYVTRADSYYCNNWPGHYKAVVSNNTNTRTDWFTAGGTWFASTNYAGTYYAYSNLDNPYQVLEYSGGFLIGWRYFTYRGSIWNC